jgi:hypothetical protein
VRVPKGEALEILTQCYANKLQCPTEHNVTGTQKVTYKVFTKCEVLVPVAIQDATILLSKYNANQANAHEGMFRLFIFTDAQQYLGVN